MHIALVENNVSQAQTFKEWLEDAGHSYIHFKNRRSILQTLNQEKFDLYILEQFLPDGSGLDVLHAIRVRITDNPPVLFVSSCQREEDIVEALRKGADTYITKPIRQREMLARINALLRRSLPLSRTSRFITLGSYELDLETKTVHYHGQTLSLTGKECKLAELLFSNVGRTLSRNHLMQLAWDDDEDTGSRALDTHISNLRKKLKLTPASGLRLKGIYQHGYRLDQVKPDGKTVTTKSRAVTMNRRHAPLAVDGAGAL